ncbi:hypothetical protein [Azospirillum sp. sgz301742]
MPRKLGDPLPKPPDSGKVRGLDGYLRAPQEEAELNSAVFHTFTTAPGEACLTWLRTVTVEAVLDPSRSDAELRHQEGMRHLVKLIEARLSATTRR